jgi:hypothetical protein
VRSGSIRWCGPPGYGGVEALPSTVVEGIAVSRPFAHNTIALVVFSPRIASLNTALPTPIRCGIGSTAMNCSWIAGWASGRRGRKPDRNSMLLQPDRWRRRTEMPRADRSVQFVAHACKIRPTVSRYCASELVRIVGSDFPNHPIHTPRHSRAE